MKKQQLAWQEEMDSILEKYYVNEFIEFIRNKHSKILNNDETFKNVVFKILLQFYYNEYPEHFETFLEVNGWIKINPKTHSFHNKY